METVWFCLVAAMLAVYVVLDGFDLGAGILHLRVARSEPERAAVLRSVGPVWDGNEVWLVAATGTILAAFPALYAAAFSGFYLQLILVLWLLVGRAVGIEFRNLLESPVWRSAWDAVFALSSGMLALFLGVALGNVVRGVPLQADGTFFEPLWTDFSPFRATGILDGYTLLVGLLSTAALALHGAHWVWLKTEGDLSERARRAAGRAWWAVLAATIVVTAWTPAVQPHAPRRFAGQPWGFVFPLLALGGLALSFHSVRRGVALRAFLGSTAFLAGMMATVAFSLYPFVLPASTDPALGLTVRSAAASSDGLKTQLAWWIPGIALAAVYFAYVYRKFSGKVRLEEGGY